MIVRIRISVVLVITLLVALGSLTVPARAQVVPLELDVPQIAALGIGVLPDYEGSDDYTMGVAPFFRYTFKGSERYLQLRANEVSFNLVNMKNFWLGPVLTYQFARDHVEDSVVKHMEDIDGTVMGGIFADYVIRLSSDPRNRLIIGADWQVDLGGVNNGNKGGVGVRYWFPIAKPIDIFIGGRMEFASGNYMQTYFGVNGEDAARTGLPVYNSAGGAKNYAFMAGATFYLSPAWALAAGFRYSRLLDHASDSPIVDKRGSANQFMGGLGIAYMWQ